MAAAMERAKSLEKPALKGAELNDVLKRLSEERGLDPRTVERFLATDFEQTGALPKMDKWIPGGLIAAYAVSFALVNSRGASMPTLGELSPFFHELLQSVHNLSVNAAKSPAIRDHLPFLALEAGGLYGALKTTPEWLRLRSGKMRTKEGQDIVRSKIESGEMRYEMAEGHTAAFVGGGDWLADRLQETKAPDQVMQYAHLNIGSGVWQMLQKQRRQSELFEALDRGDFGKAGEALILPVKEKDMFLPGKDGHDMSLDEVESLIGILHSYCEYRNIPPKKILVAGSKTLEEIYVTRTKEGSIEKGSATLLERINELKDKISNIEIVDPTEIVMRKIVQLAAGREITLAGSIASDERYGERFFQALKDIEGTDAAAKQEKVRVLYNITDVPTEVHVGSEDIAVILDPSRKETLLNKGVREENIIVVPDEVSAVLGKKVEET